MRSLTADKGYFAVEEIAQIQEFDIRTVIGDANAARRRKEALAAPLRKTLHRAACAVKSQSGKALLRKRGMHLERSFEHVLDEGGRVNALNPGIVETEGTHSAGVIGSEFETGTIAQTPLGRIGQGGDIASIAVFLASDDSAWPTGEQILAGGGLR